MNTAVVIQTEWLFNRLTDTLLNPFLNGSRGRYN